MTIAQEDIARYIRTQLADGYHIATENESIIKLTRKNGQTLHLTCNIFGDIMDADTKKIIARSNLPHNLDKLSYYARPTEWENILPYLG